MTPPTLNGDRAIAVRLLHFWKGAWIAEVTLDPDVAAQAPTSGPASLSLLGQTLTGAVDPVASGSFLSGARARVVGGAGGWDKPVAAQDFHSDTGVLSTQVYSQTGALVGETVTDLAPQTLGVDVVRMAGPAARIFGARDWYVDLAGVTNVGPRPSAAPDATLEVLDFDPLAQCVEFASDAIVMPNTTLRDPRFNGASPVVRDVEQLVDAKGSRGTAWCSSSAVSRLASALANLVVEASARSFLRAYRYRLAVYQGSRLALQAVNSQAGAPDIIPLAPWSGLAGAFAKLAHGQEVFVGFDHTTAPPTPIVLGYSLDSLPLESSVDASVAVHVGASAPSVELAGGAMALATAPWAAGIAAALATLATGLASGTLASMASAGTALGTALSSLPPSATARTKAT